MAMIVFAGGLLALACAFTYAQLRSAARTFEADLRDFAATVPAPLTADVERWLRPQLRRRTLYPTLGHLWGLMAANLPLAPGWRTVPWYWFAILIGIGIGSTTGSLLAGYRTAALVDGPTRVVDPVRRRVSHHFDRTHTLRLRLAVAISVLALVLVALVALSSDDPLARRALVACTLGAVLVVAHYWVAAQVISRPMVASTPDALLWQKAVLAKTVDGLPDAAFFLAAFCAAMAVYATVAASPGVPAALLLSGVGFAVLVTVSGTQVVLAEGRSKGWWRADAPAERAVP